MFPLITAVELLARDFVLAADRRCEFPSKCWKKNKKSSTLLLSFAMTYIQIKFSLLLLCLFSPHWMFCPVKRAQLFWFLFPPSVLPHRHWLLNEREFAWEQRIAEDPSTACGAWLLGVCTWDCYRVKVQQISSQMAWLSLKPLNPQVSPHPIGKSSHRSRRHDWVIKMSGQISKTYRKRNIKQEENAKEKYFMLHFWDWKTRIISSTTTRWNNSHLKTK